MHVCFFHLHIFLRKFPFPLFSITVCGAHPSLDLVKEPPVTLRSKIVLSFLPPFHSAPFSLLSFFFFSYCCSCPSLAVEDVAGTRPKSGKRIGSGTETSSVIPQAQASFYFVMSSGIRTFFLQAI